MRYLAAVLQRLGLGGIGVMRFRTHYKVEGWRNGRRIWIEEFDNLVVTAGLNAVLDAAFKTGLAAPAWYLGLVNNASFSAYDAADTLAAHAGWLETAAYTGNRKAWTPGAIAAGSVSNSGSPASFAINATITVRGAFLCDAASGSSGTLYGAGDFSAARSLLSGDTLTVTATLTAAAA